ncbi:MAG TPA: FHA domain-containing protein [Bacteriovoracaceae bacterium]|nr:FHA domain-containing protein [Bacteriovoracaceae bacterium]
MRLSVQIEFDKILDLEIEKATVLVGRSKNCDLVIPHEGVSREHCAIDFQKNHYFITDLESANGVYIDGAKIQPRRRVAIPPGATLKLGSLECQLTSEPAVCSISKIVSSTVSSSGDKTATIRLARIDLERPPLTMTEPHKLSKGQRNPVLVATIDSRQKKLLRKKEVRSIFVIILILAAVAFFATQA